MRKKITSLVTVFTLLITLAGSVLPVFNPTAEAATIRPMIFPILGGGSFSDDFGDPRSGGRTHEGNDIFARKGHPLVATVDGTVRQAAYPQPSYGYIVIIEDTDGYEYWYLHINNDTPGTDDGNGGGMNAYAPGMERGAPVKAGQLIGWVGDSGNAEGTSPHLHFEIHEPDGDVINPYESLVRARRISTVVPAPLLEGELLPFGGFKGGASLAVGEIDATTTGQELVVAAGPGGGPQVIIYNEERKLSQFFAYPREFRGGVDVTTGDFDGDGTDEIVTAAGRGGLGEVHIYDSPGQLRDIIFPYSKFNGEVRVAAADLDGDGKDELITAPGRGGGPDIRVYNGDGVLVAKFLAYSSTFRGGVDVAAVSATENTPGSIVTVPLTGGGPHVKVQSMLGEVQAQFFAYRKEFRGGVHVTTGTNSQGTPMIYTVPAAGDDADIHEYNLSGNLIDTRSEFEIWWRGGYDIAADTQGNVMIAPLTSPRRTSVRTVASAPDFPDWFHSQPDDSEWD